MGNKMKVICYMRVATCEQLSDKEQDLRRFAIKHNYEISDFVIEQQSGLAACSKTLNELLHNQSVRNILTPNISGFSREISVLHNIMKTANQEKISSAQTEAQKAISYTDDFRQ